MFSGALSALAESDVADVSRGPYTIELRRDPNGFCYRIVLPSGVDSTGCFDEPTLRSGFAYGAYRDHDWPLTIIGVVPDDVAGVEIAGESVGVVDNVWTYEATDGDDLAFTVVGQDGERVVLGEA